MRNCTPLSLYEEVGSAAARRLREIESGHPSLVATIGKMRDFLWKYQAAPLFVIGLTAEALLSIKRDSYGDGDVAGGISKFRLPYPTMILDFPEGIAPFETEEPFLLFIDTLDEGKYYVEKLCTWKGRRRYLEKLSAREPRLEELRRQDKDDLGLWEAAAFILTVDEVLGHPSVLPNSELVRDCQVPADPQWHVTSYCAFSVCAPKGGCIRTPECSRNRKEVKLNLAALDAVISYINLPDRYLVKVTHERTDREKRLAGKGRVPSFSKKEMHVVLNHSQVREIVAASEAGSGHHSTLPHQRRGHWRELRADRFKEKGRIWVRPTDINKGLTVKVKKSIYEVVS